MNTHTPGPWATQTYIPGEDDFGDPFEAQHQIVAPHCEVATGIQCSEDARLIAAAPDLLQALQEIVAATVDGGSINKIARAAIAKAIEYPNSGDQHEKA